MIVDEKRWSPSTNGLDHAAAEPKPSALEKFTSAIRYGGAWFVRWPIRVAIATAIVAAGFLPYKYEVGGKCRVVAVREAALRSQLQDEIASVLVSEGDLVSPGQTVAALAGREVRSLHAEALADVASAESNLQMMQTGSREEDLAKAAQMVAMWESQVKFWEAEHEREKNLQTRNAGVQAAIEKAHSSLTSSKAMLQAARDEERKLQSGYREENIAAAEARLNKAKANLHLQEQRLPLLEIKSTIAGKVSTPGVELRVGQAVSPGDMIVVVRDPSALEVEVLADEAAADVVKVGQAVKIRLWGQYGELQTGKVDRISDMASEKAQLTIEEYRTDREYRQEQIRFDESDTRYVKIIVKLDDVAPELLPGMTGQARVVIGDDCFWNSLWRPIERFVLVEVWSWLP